MGMSKRTGQPHTEQDMYILPLKHERDGAGQRILLRASSIHLMAYAAVSLPRRLGLWLQLSEFTAGGNR